MRVFIDTNVFISVIEGSEGSGVGRKILNKEWEICTSVLNLMEIRTVLVKKKHEPQEKVESIIEWLKDQLDTVFERLPELYHIEGTQKDTLLYPLDCIFHHISDDKGMPLVTFDSELLDHGGTSPETLV